MTAPSGVNTQDLQRTIRDLRELIEAIDRRLPQVERSGESTVANAAMVLRTEAVARIAAIEQQLSA